MARASSGTLSSRNRSSAGMPAFDARVSGPSFTSRLFSCGARTASDFKAGLSCTAAGRNSSTSGFVVTEKRLTRSMVCRCATRKAGNALIVAASAFACAGGGRERGIAVVDQLLESARESGRSTRTPDRRRAAACWWRRCRGSARRAPSRRWWRTGTARPGRRSGPGRARSARCPAAASTSRTPAAWPGRRSRGSGRVARWARSDPSAGSPRSGSFAAPWVPGESST